MNSQLQKWIGQNEEAIVQLKHWKKISKFVFEQTGEKPTAQEVFDCIRPEKIISCSSAWFVSWTVGYRSCAKGCKCYTERLSKKISEQKMSYSPEKKAEVRARRIATVRETFSVDNVFQLAEIKEKSTQTKVEKYNNPNYNNRAQATDTVTERYGVSNVMKLAEVAQKVHQGRDYYAIAAAGNATKISRYGTASYNNQAKAVATCLEKYGVRNPSLSDVIKDRISRGQARTFVPQHCERYNITPLFEVEEYQAGSYHKWRCNSCNTEMLGKVANGFFTRCLVCFPYSKSKEETEVRKFIEELNVEIINNSRNIIPPKEIDIYIPEQNLAIEYCGIYWHTEKGGKDRQYHKNKLDRCLKQNIRLVTLFSNFWYENTEIVQSRLAHLLGKTKTRIHARKCSVSEISKIQSDEFLIENNLYGISEEATVYYGLIHNSELVCVAAFDESTDQEYQLERFSIKNNTHIPGAVSKLISSVIRYRSPTRITAINDNNWGYSIVYEKVGFTKTAELSPAASWINTSDIRNISSTWLPEFDGNDKITPIWDCGRTMYTIEVP